MMMCAYRNFRFIVVMLAFLLWLVPCSAYGIDYEALIKENYKRIEQNLHPGVIKTWIEGMKDEYGLIFDHLGLTYKMEQEADTTDGNHLVCGVLTVTGYAKDKSGFKKRIIQRRALCHLYKEEKAKRIISMGFEESRLVLGWEDSILL